ncbi:hypothetical protein ACA910_013416 [Epithemia clementina (nom. ined.)]
MATVEAARSSLAHDRHAKNSSAMRRHLSPRIPSKQHPSCKTIEQEQSRPGNSSSSSIDHSTDVQSSASTLQENSAVEPDDEIVLLGEVVGANGLVLYYHNEPSHHHHRHHNHHHSHNYSPNGTRAKYGIDEGSIHDVVQYSSSDNSNSSDDDPNNNMEPFATIQFGAKTIHQTEPCVDRGRNPLWTPLSTHSLFVVRTTPAQLLKRQYLTVTLWTHSHCGNKEKGHPVFLGKTRVNAKTILSNCNEERITLNLVNDLSSVSSSLSLTSTCLSLLSGPANAGDYRGSVTLRFRYATPSDEEVVAKLNETNHHQLMSNPDTLWKLLNHPRTTVATASKSSCLVTEMNEFEMAAAASGFSSSTSSSQSSPATFMNVLSSAFQSSSVRDDVTGQIKYRVKPHADPDRPSSTEFLSKEEIQTETLKPSKKWIHAGSGTLGKLYLEILSCHGLPNLDAVVAGQSVGGNLTDAFVTAVFEDAMVQTDVIDDELSPHWLPWTRRAFAFGIMHPASMLYLGCFDYDYTNVLLNATTALGGGHDAIGRVSINICNLARNVDHTLQYHWHTSCNVTERQAIYGTVTIRLRVEMVDERAAVLAAIRNPLPTFHVNVQKEESMQVLLYTCFGRYGDEQDSKRFDLTVVKSYLHELQEYKLYLGFMISDALQSLVFWRGQVCVCGGFSLPIHSLLFFCVASTLVERPQMFPAFLILSVPSILLAAGAQRQQHPSPWYRGPSFWDFIKILQNDGALHSSLDARERMREISPWEGNKETKEYDHNWEERIKRQKEHYDEAIKQAQVLQHLKQDLRSSEDTKENSSHGHSSALNSNIAERLIPVEWLARLGLLQAKMAVYCRYIRLAKIIVMWEEGILSFWITTCFLAAGLLALILPWGWILTWSGRCLVWGLLGPHMMVVDAYLKQRQQLVDKKNMEGHKKQQLLQNTFDQFNRERIRELPRAQQAAKQKEVKSLLFGRYSSRVPIFNLSRHHDRPLPMSFSTCHSNSYSYYHSKMASNEEAASASNRNYQVISGQQLFGVMIPRLEEGSIAFERDRISLKIKAAETKTCLNRIREAQQQKARKDLQKKTLRRLSLWDERRASTSQELGCKMIPYGRGKSCSSDDNEEDKKDECDDGPLIETPVSANSSTSVLEVDDDAHVAVLSFERRFSCSTTTEEIPGGSRRKSVRCGYEMVHFDSHTGSDRLGATLEPLAEQEPTHSASKSTLNVSIHNQTRKEVDGENRTVETATTGTLTVTTFGTLENSKRQCPQKEHQSRANMFSLPPSFRLKQEELKMLRDIDDSNSNGEAVLADPFPRRERGRLRRSQSAPDMSLSARQSLISSNDNGGALQQLQWDLSCCSQDRPSLTKKRSYRYEVIGHDMTMYGGHGARTRANGRSSTSRFNNKKPSNDDLRSNSLAMCFMELLLLQQCQEDEQEEGDSDEDLGESPENLPGIEVVLHDISESASLSEQQGETDIQDNGSDSDSATQHSSLDQDEFESKEHLEETNDETTEQSSPRTSSPTNGSNFVHVLMYQQDASL